MLTHSLMKHLGEVGTRKKRTASRVFFFLPAFSQCCPSVSGHKANYIHCSSNIAIADHFPSKTFFFKHHLTGEAWPACRAILPFHSNTTCDRRGMLGMVSVYRTYVHYIVAKNRHLNIVLQAELFLRTGTYDRLTNTLAIDSACAPLDSALAMRPAPLHCLSCYGLAIDR